MRLPRVQFKVGTLLFAVAVIAANCWAFLLFDKVHVSSMTAGGSYRVLPLGVGVLPLINVGFIGTWFAVVRWIRSMHYGRTESPRSSFSSGITYFSLHFLVLGALASYFLPDLIDLTPGSYSSQEGIFETVTEYAADGWNPIFGAPGGTAGWILFEGLMLGFFISGPPLLFSWIVHKLATRCVATLPRWRFRVLAALVAVGFLSADLAICLTPRRFEDETELALDFQVIDEASNQPIATAFVCIIDPFERDETSIPPRDFTDAAGRARLTGRFLVKGDRNAFQTLGAFSPWGRWLEVSSADHQTRRIPLTEILGDSVDSNQMAIHQVALPRGQTPEGTFHELAGYYLAGGNGFGGRWFKIEPDGRFAWCVWGCMPPDSQEYGRVKRHGDEIELVLIPHPGREVDPFVTTRFRQVIWGERRYLSSTDPLELYDICREALTPYRDSYTDDLYGPSLRVSDREKPQTGLPQFPTEIWLNFFAKEFNLRSEDENPRLTLVSRDLEVSLRSRVEGEGPVRIPEEKIDVR